MRIPSTFIIIKGEAKALQIERFGRGENGVFDVKFFSSPNTYHYAQRDVVWLKEAVWHDPEQTKVYVNGCEQRGVTDVRSFADGGRTHWRITYQNGYVRDYLHGSIHVVESCLGDEVARNTFEYLKRVAKINELGKDEENGGILGSLYEKIDFVEDSLVAAPYLNPDRYRVGREKTGDCLFPFGCNASQKRAVYAALGNQMSVIQGPPGTGKTQTILNIIANILVQGKTVLVVSNNNSATANVQEKLQKYGFGFVVASLGKRENKEAFIANQPLVPADVDSWKMEDEELHETRKVYAESLSKTSHIFELQEELARLKQEQKEVELEWGHFREDNDLGEVAGSSVSSMKLMKLWLGCQQMAERRTDNEGLFRRLIGKLRLFWLNLKVKRLLGQKLDLVNPDPVVTKLQAMYYVKRQEELGKRTEEIEGEQKDVSALECVKNLTDASLRLFSHGLNKKYGSLARVKFTEVADIRRQSEEFLKQYPVVLSTTFSARTSMGEGVVFDYVIMDEASQVSVDTGALALTCARNAVIVGDTMQLPNVVTEDDMLKYDGVFREFDVKAGYDCGRCSFLQSVCTIIPEVEQTLLREHYRCHPKIIGFCNQKFYGGNLLIMTEDKAEEDVLMAVRTVAGEHTRGCYNQREIDVIRQEVLPRMEGAQDVGVIAPYNAQVDAIGRQLPELEAATVHKFQGREKDTIIMSVVDDQIGEFADDANLLNVAISRAKNRFCIVLSGNEQERIGNISELVEYIEYNNFTVTDSKISSVFDYLYSSYTEQRLAYLKESKRVSEFDSENLMYRLLTDILGAYPEFSHLGVLCHVPVRNVIRDFSLMDERERKYVSHYATHLDFLLINHVTKKPVLAIETDGYNYHNDTTDQHQRDLMKDSVMRKYALPLLRLSTVGSGEREKIVGQLHEIVE